MRKPPKQPDSSTFKIPKMIIHVEKINSEMKNYSYCSKYGNIKLRIN
jgi:hypothetical protein